jgi:hypothetical protein
MALKGRPVAQGREVFGKIVFKKIVFKKVLKGFRRVYKAKII